MNRIVKGTCIDLSFEGKGVVKDKNDVIFVDGLFIGEEAEIEIKYKREGCFFGKVNKLLKVSEKRIQPKCKVCTACGGCCFQQLSYDEQLVYKTNKVQEQLYKIGKIKYPVKPTVGMSNPYNYRNKIQIPFKTDHKGNPVYGFYRANTHEIIPIEQCYIEDERAYDILKTIKYLIPKYRIKTYDEDKRFGFLRHVLIRTGKYSNQIMVVLVTNGFDFPGRSNFIKELTQKCPQISTIIQNINSRHTNVILGEHEKTLYGKGYIEDTLCGLNYKISAKSFYQTNPEMTERLYQFAIESANITREDIVFDAYSGIGTIGLTAASHAKEVISAEIVKEAVVDAKDNAKRNNISNLKAYQADATEFILEMAKRKQHIDVLMMDPPRKGSTPDFISAVKELKPTRVVYISCDPSSLARDLRDFIDMYKIEVIQPFDMFPQTFHVETVCLLTLKQ